MVPVVIGARDVDRRREVFEPDLLPARLGDLERLQSAPHVLAGNLLLAGELLGGADRLGDQHRVEHAAVVEILADLVAADLALALVDHVFEDVLNRREAGADRIDVERAVALGIGAGRTGVVIASRPPHADQAAHRKAGPGRLLDRGGVHGAPALEVDPVGPVAADVEPQRGLVLHLRARHRVELELEAVILGQLLEQRNRLLAVGRIEIDQPELLALELVEPALDLGGMFDEHRGAVPIGRRRIEDPGEQIAVGRWRQTVAHRQDRDLVDRRLRNQLQGDAGRIRVHHHRALALDRLVALDALLGVVAGLAFLHDDLHPADAPVALVEHVEIIGHAVGDRRSGTGVGTGAVAEQRDVDSVGGIGGRNRGGDTQGDRDRRAEH